MSYRTPKEAKKANVAAMGEALGGLYSALWQSVATIHFYWNEYVALFGTKPQRIQLLNRAAPRFFRMLQDQLWEISLLHLARLTDPANSQGNKDRANLTIQALPELVVDAVTRNALEKLIAEAIQRTKFCRDWRNRHIAHRDLKLALEQSTTPLAEASRAHVNAALKAITDVLNAIEDHYCKSETRFDFTSPPGGALSLLYVVDAGLRAQALRQERFAAGKMLEEDLGSRDL
jgi:hypothetical protein